MELFHVLNRGVDGRDIFTNNRDYYRFVHDLYEFNDTAPADNNTGYRFTKSRDLRSPYIARERERLVDIHGWVLMKNHYHLLLSEFVENGITHFLRKLNIGYAKYFNEAHKRTGTLFQGRTKKILLERDEHFLYILHYIHLNPLDYLQGSEQWRVRDQMSIASVDEALTYLRTYRWSSYLDYAQVHNFPSILTTSLFTEALGDPNSALKEYLQSTNHTASSLTKLSLE